MNFQISVTKYTESREKHIKTQYVIQKNFNPFNNSWPYFSAFTVYKLRVKPVWLSDMMVFFRRCYCFFLNKYPEGKYMVEVNNKTTAMIYWILTLKKIKWCQVSLLWRFKGLILNTFSTKFCALIWCFFLLIFQP